PDIKNHLLRRQFYAWLLENPADTGASVPVYSFYQKSDTASYGRFARARQYMIQSMTDSLGRKSTLLSSATAESDAITATNTFLAYEADAIGLLARYLAEGDIEELMAASDTL